MKRGMLHLDILGKLIIAIIVIVILAGFAIAAREGILDALTNFLR